MNLFGRSLVWLNSKRSHGEPFEERVDATYGFVKAVLLAWLRLSAQSITAMGVFHAFTGAAGAGVPPSAGQQAYVKASNPGGGIPGVSGDRFGSSVAISENTLVVGAPFEASSSTGVNSTPNEGAGQAGAAYVFARIGGVWTQQAYLKPAAVGISQFADTFGAAVAVSGDTLIVGAPSESSDTRGVNSSPNEGALDSGAAYIFNRIGTNWMQQAYLKPAAFGTNQAFYRFGFSVAISGDTVVVGAIGESSSTTGVNSEPNNSMPQAGAAYVFTRTGTNWTQQAYLKPAAIGTSQAFDQFGISVAVSGDTVIVGARFEDSSTTGVNSSQNEEAADSGAAYVFTRTGTNWTQQAYLKPAANGVSQAQDHFGGSVAISGDTVVVGALDEDSNTRGVNSVPNEAATNSGAAYVFTRTAGIWSQQAYLKPAAFGTSQAGDQFGLPVAISRDTIVVGATGEDSGTTGIDSVAEDDGTVTNSGAAYVFTRIGTNWVQQAYLKPAAVGVTQTEDRFGSSAAISDGLVAVGARFEDSSTPGVNRDPNEAARDSGAAYIFSGLGTPEIAVTSNNANINSGDTSPSAVNNTDFGSVALTGGTALHTFTIRNSGVADLTLGTVSIRGPHAMDFTSTQPLSATVTPGNSTTFEIAFHPTALGVRSATVSFGNNDGDENPFSFAIQGTASNTPPILAANHSVVITGEGLVATNSGTFMDVDGDTVRISTSIGIVTKSDLSESWSWLYTPPDGPAGPTTVTITADDGLAAPVTTTFTLGVTNRAPAVLAATNLLLLESCTSATNIGIWSDPAGVNDTVTLTVDVGSVQKNEDGTWNWVLAPTSLGSTTVTLMATDDDGTSTVTTFIVRVLDTTPPVITCLSSRTVECGTDWGFAQPEAMDLCGGTNVTLVVTDTRTNELPRNALELTRTWRATDQSGNSATCSQTLVVADTTPPRLVCPGTEGMRVECTMPAQYPVSAVDNCDQTSSVTCFPPTGSVLPLGSTTVNCVSMDASGNSNSCQFIVTVVDTTPPQVVCPSNLLIQVTGRNDAIVNWTFGAMDECGSPARACVPSSDSRFQLGQTPVQCTATDASGNQTACSFVVTIERLNLCPTALALSTARCPTNATPGALIISPNNSNAWVILDGRLSTDPDGDALSYAWLMDDFAFPFATNVLATNSLPVGHHEIRLIVSDGRCDADIVLNVEILTACEAIEELIPLVDSAAIGRRNKRPLIASLKAACASLERAQFSAARGQLNAFQNKVRDQIHRDFPMVAEEWVAAVQMILDVTNTCN